MRLYQIYCWSVDEIVVGGILDPDDVPLQRIRVLDIILGQVFAEPRYLANKQATVC